jgi:hypothetical protein
MSVWSKKTLPIVTSTGSPTAGQGISGSTSSPKSGP